MQASPDAILLGLELLRSRVVSGREVAGFVRAAAQSKAADQSVAMGEQILARRPDLTELVLQCQAAPPYIPLHCNGCGGRFRVGPEQAVPTSTCPLCGEALATRAEVLFLSDWAMSPARAAEASPGYALVAQPRFAHFDLVKLIGRGGAGRVYEARNRRVGRVVALKLLHFRPLESAAETFGRLRRESRAAVSIKHQSIVRVLDLGVAEGVPFVEMELVRGVSLDRRVKADGPIAPLEACTICAQTLSGLECVHRARIVHGDVKPGNIMVDELGRARLTDFGIATFLEETTSLTAGGRAIGSPHFMAPEQWRGEPLSPRTDVYAMGLVLYFMLTGSRPYEGQTGPALMYKHLEGAAAELKWGMPERLRQIIRHATRTEPEERFAGAEEFRDALDAFIKATEARELA